MIGLPVGEESLKIRQTVLTQYHDVMDGRAIAVSRSARDVVLTRDNYTFGKGNRFRRSSASTYQRANKFGVFSALLLRFGGGGEAWV